LAVDRAKALADYATIRDNAFWQYFWEIVEKKKKDEMNVLATTSELRDIYHSQGRVELLGTLSRLPEELASILRS
jgi:hypothetical protein